MKWPPWQMNTPEVFCFILLTVFITPVSLIFVILFLRSQDRSRKTFFSPSNESPHTEVNNINTYVTGVKAGALLKLIFQNVFLLLLQLQGSPPLRTSLSYNQSLCGGSSEEGRRTWERRPGYVSILGSVPQTDTDLEQKIRDEFSLDSFLRSLHSCLPLYLLGLVTATLQNHQRMPFVDAHLESHLQIKCSIPPKKPIRIIGTRFAFCCQRMFPESGGQAGLASPQTLRPRSPGVSWPVSLGLEPGQRYMPGSEPGVPGQHHPQGWEEGKREDVQMCSGITGVPTIYKLGGPG